MFWDGRWCWLENELNKCSGPMSIRTLWYGGLSSSVSSAQRFIVSDMACPYSKTKLRRIWWMSTFQSELFVKFTYKTKEIVLDKEMTKYIRKV